MRTGLSVLFVLSCLGLHSQLDTVVTDSTLIWCTGRNWVELDLMPAATYWAGGYPVDLQARAGWKRSITPTVRIKAGMYFSMSDPDWRDEFYYSDQLSVFDSLHYVRKKHTLEYRSVHVAIGMDADVFNRKSTLYGGGALLIGASYISEHFSKTYWIPNTSLGCLTCLEPSPILPSEVSDEELLFFEAGLEMTLGYRQHIWNGFFASLQITPALTYGVAQRERSDYLNARALLNRSFLTFEMKPVELMVSFNW
ncbi:MAG: hypothetical protein JNM00_09835 [Flavobacteriales bacterium]|nr:hypothetical protein [Flavobacteriales bacterium]